MYSLQEGSPEEIPLLLLQNLAASFFRPSQPTSRWILKLFARVRWTSPQHWPIALWLFRDAPSSQATNSYFYIVPSASNTSPHQLLSRSKVTSVVPHSTELLFWKLKNYWDISPHTNYLNQCHSETVTVKVGISQPSVPVFSWTRFPILSKSVPREVAVMIPRLPVMGKIMTPHIWQHAHLENRLFNRSWIIRPLKEIWKGRDNNIFDQWSRDNDRLWSSFQIVTDQRGRGHLIFILHSLTKQSWQTSRKSR